MAVPVRKQSSNATKNFKYTFLSICSIQSIFVHVMEVERRKGDRRDINHITQGVTFGLYKHAPNLQMWNLVFESSNAYSNLVQLWFLFVLNSRCQQGAVLITECVVSFFKQVLISAPFGPTHPTTAGEPWHTQGATTSCKLFALAGDRTPDCAGKRRLRAALIPPWPTTLPARLLNNEHTSWRRRRIIVEMRVQALDWACLEESDPQGF